MAEPTREDAQLLVQLATLFAESGVREASSWVWSDEFVSDHDEFNKKYPPGSTGFDRLMTAAGYYETIGTLWKHKLISEELLFDWLLIEPLWNRIKPVLVGIREEMGESRLFENFEAMAEASVPAQA
ncbi:MAG: DUF4760 domain-containing protein [Gaiellaceae bacterium]